MDWLSASLGLAAVGGDLWANATNLNQGRENRKFQERMSNTAYQRGTKDMLAAGLNPAAVYGHGGPASSPGGAQSSVENPLSRGVHSALAAREARARVKMIEAQADSAQEDVQEKRAERSLRELTADGEPSWREWRMAMRRDDMARVAHAANMRPQELGHAIANRLVSEHGVKRAEAEALMAQLGLAQKRAESSYYGTMGTSAVVLDKLGPMVIDVLSSMGMLGVLKNVIGTASSSSARGTGRMFPPPKPRRAGTWESYSPQPKRPAGWTP